VCVCVCVCVCRTSPSPLISSYKFSQVFVARQVPTLEQLLRGVAGRCHLLLELKSKQFGLVSSTVAALNQCGWLDAQSMPYEKGGVTVFCQDLDQLDEVGQLAPHAARMLAVSQIDAQAVRLAQAHKLQGLSTSAAHENRAAVPHGWHRRTRRHWARESTASYRGRRGWDHHRLALQGQGRDPNDDH
jgi:hypothetical protein